MKKRNCEIKVILNFKSCRLCPWSQECPWDKYIDAEDMKLDSFDGYARIVREAQAMKGVK